VTSGDRESDIRARLAEITGGAPPAGPERDLLGRLLVSYTSKTPVGIEQLESLIRAGDVTGVRQLAHALKGSATNLGVTALSRLFATVEDEARADRLPDPALAEIRTEFAQVRPICAAVAHDLQSRQSTAGAL
jgi:HPt (histidine-containing phosphotransfer) domain-containing protein